MLDQTVTCPRCGNFAYFDSKQCVSYCKSKSCQGIIIEQGKITYENEVNLHENDDQNKKQTRFGGYENKNEAFKSRLFEQVKIIESKSSMSENKARRQFYDKFEQGEEAITRVLAYCFKLEEESFLKEVIQKYRDILFNNIQDLAKKNFVAVAGLAFELVAQDRRKIFKDDRRLNRITLDLIAEKLKIGIHLIESVATTLKINPSSNKQKNIGETVLQRAESLGMPFNEEEKKVLHELPDKLMSQNLIQGQKTNTIIGVVLYMVAQLSRNPQLNTYTMDQLSQEVTKDTLKRLWNSIVENKSELRFQFWSGQRSFSELKPVL